MIAGKVEGRRNSATAADAPRRPEEGSRRAGRAPQRRLSGVISAFLENQHYASHEAYLRALGEAMKTEYDAIHDPGLVLQIDCPDLAGRENVIASTDCGFATGAAIVPIHPDVTWAKFRAMAEGAELATRELWAGSAAAA